MGACNGTGSMICQSVQHPKSLHKRREDLISLSKVTIKQDYHSWHAWWASAAKDAVVSWVDRDVMAVVQREMSISALEAFVMVKMSAPSAKALACPVTCKRLLVVMILLLSHIETLNVSMSVSYISPLSKETRLHLSPPEDAKALIVLGRITSADDQGQLANLAFFKLTYAFLGTRLRPV